MVFSLRELLAEEPHPMVAMRGLSGKSGKDPMRLIVRHDYGLLFSGQLDQEDDGEEDGDDEQDDVEDGEAESRGSRKKG